MQTYTSQSIPKLLGRLLFSLLVLNSFMLSAQGNTTIKVNSFSFNAKQKSNFATQGVGEYVERGLTIIHFMGENKYEFKSFDTYGSAEACKEFIEVMAKMEKDQARYIVLAHDSAANASLSNSQELNSLGFQKLTELKGRQAYILHNLNGETSEAIHDISLNVTLSIPNTINDKIAYFPKETFEFEPSVDRYIAHAGGEINEVRYTNTKEALDANYKKGFRLFELDIIETSDGEWVAAHDWEMWSRFTDYSGELPPTLTEFKKHTIYGDYHTLAMSDINHWFSNHKDAILVTDKINEPLKFARAFVDKERLIMELFSQLSIEEATQHGINVMMSQEPLLRLKGDKADYLTINNIEHVAVSRRIISSKKKLMLQLREKGIKVYVFNVNFDPGKDEKYVYENELGLVYGMYADKWSFDTVKTNDEPAK
ncbi:hypothetical protein [Cytophaga sp. FL35]|uniref:hypothetical protein n=1 Tax=Cytophaga sp. FL35 TaxID=1904456 RepID=UPI001653E3F1|nr:hypothetical protein [Cytophaga sp. FL35]MBC7000037.1 hypothetical protein [Cytophaga sp. FL35]